MALTTIDFYTATDILMNKGVLMKIAGLLNVGEGYLRLSRLRGSSRRAPPRGWEWAALTVAREQRDALNELIEALEAVMTNGRS